MLYTTYFSNVKKIPDNVVKIVICRYVPDFISKDKSFLWVQDLSPEENTLNKYKKGIITWPQFKARFIKQVKDKEKPTNISLKILLNLLRDGKDICLICYEKDFKHCHRYLLAKFLINKGIDWEEL